MNILDVIGKTIIFGAATLWVGISMDYLGGKHGPCSTAVIFCFCVLLQHTMTIKLGTNRIANMSFVYKNNFVTWIYKLYQNHYFNRTTMSVEMGIM